MGSQTDDELVGYVFLSWDMQNQMCIEPACYLNDKINNDGVGLQPTV